MQVEYVLGARRPTLLASMLVVALLAGAFLLTGCGGRSAQDATPPPATIIRSDAATVAPTQPPQPKPVTTAAAPQPAPTVDEAYPEPEQPTPDPNATPLPTATPIVYPTP